MTFTYPSLAIAGALLACLPIVIHLLNRRRRRRVEWAAMDFLLQSDRKNRTWVQLSEWLLLAARVAAIALVGVLAASPKTLDLLRGFFGADRARHVVLLDDTCSMQRRGPGGAAWDEAIAAIDRLADAARQSGDELMVVRYVDTFVGGDVAKVVGADAASDPAAWRPTHAQALPTAGMEDVARLCEAAPSGDRTYAYVFSDFAERSHAADGDWAPLVDRLGEMADGVVLAACNDAGGANLAVESVTLAPGPLAAGVETRLVVEVVNHSDVPAPAVALTLRRNGQPLTAVQVGPFTAGERRTVESPVTFQGVGLHTVDATLPTDALPADDEGWLFVEVPASQPVLLVDDSESGVESRVFAAALRPVGSTRSGWAPRRVEGLSEERLADAAAVVLLDAERLSELQTQRLRDYVADGGGVWMVIGPRTDAAWFNQRVAGVLAGENALTPWRLGPAISGPVVAPGQPALEAADHPAVRVLAGKQNGFLPLVRLVAQRRLATSDESPTVRNVATSAESGYEVLLKRVDGEPLLLENRFGAGRVVALLTTTATGSGGSEPWSNLATLPIFPVMANDVVGWLSQERLRPLAEAIVTAKGEAPPRSSLVSWVAGGDLVEATPLGQAAPLTPSRPGAYRRVLGGVEERPFAARVHPDESDLRSPSLAVLSDRWGSVARVGRAGEMFRDAPTPASRTPLYFAAAVLLATLAGERLLAYRNSYVGSASTGAAPKGAI
ncbi:BatA domain-containing protein [Botrimarina mediterranea]|uniref:Aerotolerance regulator N-terminal domain-containing protein n=1 Tax=Botrimarina mediterranea TaxID=2528022 RepID=A0A518K589_9BACT|nr:BatA domain-containing protein [Botrimarina mediterranea]QDV72960.1 hypothetical protein Spa11_11470 [Botrimarina mediterranea]